MELNNCECCKNGYMAGGELLCIGFMEPEYCNSYQLDEYFENELEIEESEDE